MGVNRAGPVLAVQRRVPSSDAGAHAIVARVQRLASSSLEGIATIRAAAPAREAALRIAARLRLALDAHGYAAARPGESGAAGPPGRPGHVALLICDRHDAAAGIVWLRALTGAGPEAHLVIDLRAGSDLCAVGDWNGGGHAPAIVRESRAAVVSARVWPQPPPVFRPPWHNRLLERAQGSLRRGRSTAGARWARAAIASGHRTGDEDLQVAARLVLLRDLARRGRWREAAAEARLSLPLIADWDGRVDAGCFAARGLVVSGDLSLAIACLTGLSAEAHLRGREPPAAVNVRLAEARFWQGRFEEARAALSGAEEAIDGRAIAALLRWADGDTASIRDAADRLLAGADPCPFRARLAQACQIEEQLAEGRTEEGLAALGARRNGTEAVSLHEALFDRLRAVAADDPRAARSADLFTRRSGALAIARWGMGRQGMQLLHAMPALLNVMHDAEDERAVLAASCQWLREQARADAAGFVGVRAERWIESDGFAAGDLSSQAVRDVVGGDGRTVAHGGEVVVSAPVRWTAATTGYVVARGGALTADVLVHGVQTVAALAAPALRARLDGLALAEAGDSLAPEILGLSPAMAAVRDAVARAALTTFPVLVDGESGTGKELVARAVHRLSPRRDRRFCAVNCAALTDELVEAELFGHARGAFTGAIGQRAGLFEEAHLGTLFLDEVSELSPRAQAKVLRVLQEREIRRLGENGSRQVDVRIVAATNRPLADAVTHGQFRHDLLFRLLVVRITLPPLRERTEDVPLLAQAFARRLTPEAGRRILLGPDAIAALARHPWPGNVRELQNTIAALSVLAPARGRVTARHVAQVLSATAPGSEPAVLPLVTARETLERRMVSASLARHAGSLGPAARELGLSRQGLSKAIRRLGLSGLRRAQGAA